jgi:hypothetical protein
MLLPRLHQHAAGMRAGALVCNCHCRGRVHVALVRANGWARQP